MDPMFDRFASLSNYGMTHNAISCKRQCSSASNYVLLVKWQVAGHFFFRYAGKKQTNDELRGMIDDQEETG